MLALCVPHLILPSVPLPLIPAGLQETYLATMDAVDSVSPGSALFILQGLHQEGQLAGAAAPPTWGSGFSTDPALTSQGASGVSDWGIQPQDICTPASLRWHREAGVQRSFSNVQVPGFAKTGLG